MTQPTDPRARLMTMRIIWAALLMGQILFLAIIFFVMWPNDPPGRGLSDQIRTIYLYVAGGMLITAIPMGYFIRSMAYRTRGSDGKIVWTSYFTGNIILWALSEGVSFGALVFMLLDHKPWPFLGIAIVAMANQAINFPTGNT